jgi:atypical dual specificity phosphatase
MDELFDLMVNLDTFSRLTVWTDIVFTQGFCKPVGMIPYTTPRDPHQVALDLYLYFQHFKCIIRKFEKNVNKSSLIARDFRLAYGDETKGLCCLLHIYRYTPVYENMHDMIQSMWVLTQTDNLENCPEASFTDEDWKSKMRSSLLYQYEYTGYYKYYVQYTGSLWYNRGMTRLGYFQWYTEILDNLILGGMPLRTDFQQLRDLGVQCILSVVECYENHSPGYMCDPVTPQEWIAHHVDYLQVPICDFEEMNLDKVQICVAYIHWCIRKNKKIYIHCRVAVARSVLIVMAYLVKYQKLSSQDALSFVKSKRPQIQNKHFELLQQYERLVNS